VKPHLSADLVLQGGGVKGIALTGAVLEFLKTYRFRRVAGTSAGSIVGAFLAAGYTPSELTAAMNELRYDRVPDRRIPFL
jgi:NTE family protein